MNNFLWFFGAVIFLRFILNLNNYLQVKKLDKKYEDYLRRKIDYRAINEIKNEFQEIISKAGVEESFVPHIQHIGYGQLIQANVSVIDNIQVFDQEIVVHVTSLLSKASGAFKKRMIECFNPLYWIETIIFLPKTFFSYIGIGKEKAVVKLFQILWAIFLSAVGFFYTLYRPEIDNVVKSYIQSIVK